jgi:hypothetical protein
MLGKRGMGLPNENTTVPFANEHYAYLTPCGGSTHCSGVWATGSFRNMGGGGSLQGLMDET